MFCRKLIVSLAAGSLFMACVIATPATAEPAWNLKMRKAGDPELQAAKDQAQKHWPMFVAEIKKNPPKAGDSNFSVKVPLHEGETVEHMWVSVDTVSGDSVKGILDNDPDYIHNYRVGQQMTVKKSDVEDWSYKQGDKLIGGWSVAVFLKEHPELKSKMPNYVQPK